MPIDLTYTRTVERRNRNYRSVTIHVLPTGNMDMCANVSVMERQAIRLCGVLNSKHCIQKVFHARREKTYFRRQTCHAITSPVY